MTEYEDWTKEDYGLGRIKGRKFYREFKNSMLDDPKKAIWMDATSRCIAHFANFDKKRQEPLKNKCVLQVYDEWKKDTDKIVIKKQKKT